MTGTIQCFLVNLVKHFHQEMVAHSKSVPHLKEMIGSIESSDKLADTQEWLCQYVEETDTINYYDLFKRYIEQQEELDPSQVIAIFKEYEAERKETVNQELQCYLKNKGYSFYSGAVSDANEGDTYYLLDHHVFNETVVKPIFLSKERMEVFRKEKENQNLPVLLSVLSLYFKHLIVTQRGIESTERVDDCLIEVAYYKNLMDYTKLHPYVSQDASDQKLFSNGVNPSLPFVEVIIDGYGEYYRNYSDLKTERDIIQFVNHSYCAEGLDRKAKSFERKQILKAVLHKNPMIHSDLNPKSLEELPPK